MGPCSKVVQPRDLAPLDRRWEALSARAWGKMEAKAMSHTYAPPPSEEY